MRWAMQIALGYALCGVLVWGGGKAQVVYCPGGDGYLAVSQGELASNTCMMCVV